MNPVLSKTNNTGGINKRICNNCQQLIHHLDQVVKVSYIKGMIINKCVQIVVYPDNIAATERDGVSINIIVQ